METVDELGLSDVIWVETEANLLLIGRVSARCLVASALAWWRIGACAIPLEAPCGLWTGLAIEKACCWMDGVR